MDEALLPTYSWEADYSYYPGKRIEQSWDDLKRMAEEKNFSGLNVGDYKMVTLSTGEELCMELAGINAYIGYGDVPVAAHLDFISRDCLTKKYSYNDTDTNSGGYVCSRLNMVLQTEIFPTLPEEVRDVIAIKRGLVETKIGKHGTSWSWQDLGKLWLPSEIEIWGLPTFCEDPWGHGLAIQYPIFQGSTLHMVKRLGIGGDRYNWWNLCTANGDAEKFCHAGRFGLPYRNAATRLFGVPVCFRIA